MIGSDAVRERLQQALTPRFVLQRELGGGGMSRTFVARDLELERDVVVKFPLLEQTDAVDLERFRREILLAATVQHPNVVPVLDAGDANGHCTMIGPCSPMPFGCNTAIAITPRLTACIFE